MLFPKLMFFLRSFRQRRESSWWAAQKVAFLAGLFLLGGVGALSCTDEPVEGGGSCKTEYRCVYYSGSQYNFLEQSTKCTDTFGEEDCPTDDAIGFCVKNAGKADETRITYYSDFVSAIGDPQTECLGDNGTYSVP